MDWAVEKCLQSLNNFDSTYNLKNSLDFSYIDNCSKLVIIILRLVISDNKAKILEKILGALYIVMVKYH